MGGERSSDWKHWLGRGDGLAWKGINKEQALFLYRDPWGRVEEENGRYSVAVPEGCRVPSVRKQQAAIIGVEEVNKPRTIKGR